MTSEENIESENCEPQLEEEDFSKWKNLLGIQIDGTQEQLNRMESNEIPSLDVIFPEDVDQMRINLKVLQKENLILSKKLSENEEKYDLLKIHLDTINEFKNPDTNAQLATSKIIQLDKKVKELRASKSQKIFQKKSKLNNDHEIPPDEKNRMPPNINGKNGMPQLEDWKISRGFKDVRSDSDVRKLKKQLDDNTKFIDYKNECERLKEEVNLVHEILNAELGPNAKIVIEKFKDGNNCLKNEKINWKSKAEEIKILKNKISELNDKLSQRKASFISNRNVVDILKQNEKERKIEHQKEIQHLKNETEELKRNYQGAKARNQVLESKLRDEKNKIKILIEKSETDDKIIEALKKKNKSNLTERNLEKQKNEEFQIQIKSLEEELGNVNLKCEQLIATIAERDSQVTQQEEKLKALNMSIAKQSANLVEESEFEKLKQILEQEKNEKLELRNIIETQNYEIEEMKHALEYNEELLESEQKKYFMLEKKFTNLELNKARISRR